MEILTCAQMKKVDEETINRFCPGLELMERAGRNIAEFILDMFDGERIKAVIFAGAGNNGGDALVVARHLVTAGCDCSVHRLKPPESFSMDALKNYERLQRLSPHHARLKEIDAQRPDWQALVEKDLEDATLMVDGLFGTGIRGALRGTALEMAEVMNANPQPVVSIDIPSGVDGDSGAVPGTAVRATYTVTIGRPKLGLLFHPGKTFAGEMVVTDIGFPEQVVQAHASGILLLDTHEAAQRTPERLPAAHKYRCGTLLIIAGSRAYSGAAVLAAEAALRGGCGMVFVGVPEGARLTIDTGIREAITVPLPETADGTIGLAALDALRPYLDKADALAVGPGIGRNGETDELVRAILQSSEKPVVLDADGIQAFKGKRDLLASVRGPLVITPHSGELAKLMDAKIADMPLERIEQTCRFAGDLECTLLHKGAPSIIASPAGEVLINLHGNSALATMGTGDVLTGFVGSMLAQGAGAFDAAGVGSFLLGRSGELASLDMGLRGVIAGDLLAYAGLAMVELEEALPEQGA